MIICIILNVHSAIFIFKGMLFMNECAISSVTFCLNYIFLLRISSYVIFKYSSRRACIEYIIKLMLKATLKRHAILLHVKMIMKVDRNIQSH